jgi:hypothetical protein
MRFSNSNVDLFSIKLFLKRFALKPFLKRFALKLFLKRFVLQPLRQFITPTTSLLEFFGQAFFQKGCGQAVSSKGLRASSFFKTVVITPIGFGDKVFKSKRCQGFRSSLF